MFLEQQISLLEWFLKDHMTLKTGDDAENSQEEIKLVNYINLENCYFKFE